MTYYILQKYKEPYYYVGVTSDGLHTTVHFTCFIEDAYRFSKDALMTIQALALKGRSVVCIAMQL
jgi:hypothetical protein